jgi:hypothetical protein
LAFKGILPEVGGGKAKKDLIFFLEMLQYENSKSIVRLESEIKFLREQNQILLKKLGISESAREIVNASDFNPIGGYHSLASRIAEKERKSREQYEKETQSIKEEV